MSSRTEMEAWVSPNVAVGVGPREESPSEFSGAGKSAGNLETD
jgi:hypothetical protein